MSCESKLGGVPVQPIRRIYDAPPLEEAFAPFSARVNRLQREVALLADPRLHPLHLSHGNPDSKHGIGSFKHVYRLPESPGLLVKLFTVKDPDSRAKEVRVETQKLSRLQHLADFEQIVASSHENGAIIVEEFDGIPLEDATDEMINGLTKDVLTRSVASIKSASARDIWLDSYPGNILVGRTQPRLFFLDPYPEIYPNYFENNLITLARKLASAGEGDDPKKYSVSRTARLAVLKRLREITQAELPDSRILERELNITINRFE